MIDTTQLTQLISAFRVETEKESISPETVGSLLQNITDLLATASNTNEVQIFENWKAILSQLNLVESVEQGVDNIEHVNIAMTLRDLANGGRTGQNFAIAPATAQRAGVMTAAQAQVLDLLHDAVSALELAAVNVANKNAEQDSRLDIIQGGDSVITAISQGPDHASKVYLNIRKQNLSTGEVSNKLINKEIAAATNEKAGVMTKALVNLAEEGSAERAEAEENLRKKLIEGMEQRQKEYEEKERKHQAELKKIKDEYFGNNAVEDKQEFDKAMALLDEQYKAELEMVGDNAKEKLRIEEAYEKAKLALKKKYNQMGGEEDRNAMQKWNQDLLDWLNGDGGQAVTKSVETLTSGMSSIFSQLSSLVQAEMEIETAAIEKRYEREVSMAEGNKYKTKQLEKQKQKEIAKVKDEANRKLFAMQVIQAVAQTATAALNAYSSAAAIPVVGYILAPIAAAMAIAAGAIQIATIKKQQQASTAQGYAQGGFTKQGAVDEVAGVVHAGEWVASQKLLASPVARPLIEALDYAQRTNTIGSLRQSDVSRTITAPAVLAQSQAPTVIVQENKTLRETLARLNERLNEPFVTVNTVTGDLGIKQAQDDYQRLMNNKSPKNKRK